MNKLNNLPKEIINKIKEVLKAYDSCTVVMDNGEYKVRTFNGIELNNNIEVICEISSQEIYSENERILNYIEEFKCFPYNYKIEKDSFKVLRQYEGNEITLEELATKLNLIEKIEKKEGITNTNINKSNNKGDKKMFEVYIMNLGKYNEGNLIGQWLTLPAELEEIQETLNNIEINELYEEFFIADSESQLKNFIISEYSNLDKLNQIAKNLKDFTEDELKVVDALLEGDYINENDLIEGYDIYNHSFVELGNNFFNNDLNLGYAVIEEYYNNDLSLINNIEYYFDYESFARDLYFDKSHIVDGLDNEEELDEMGETEFCDWYLEGIGDVDGLERETLERYFDYEKYGRDMRLDGAYISSNGIAIL